MNWDSIETGNWIYATAVAAAGGPRGGYFVGSAASCFPRLVG
jgi:hypothetical protein